MDTTRGERLGPVAGVLAVVLTVISFVLTSDDTPDFLDDPNTIADYYANDPGKLMGGFLVDTFGTILLVVFAAAVYVRLGGIRRGTLPPAAFGGAVAMCAMFMVYDVINLGLTFRADEDGSVPAESAAVLNDIANLALGLGGTMFAAVFVACTAWSALGNGVLPRWLCYLSFLLALGLVIGPISWAFLPILLLWVLAVSVIMWMDRGAAPAPGAATPA